MDINYTYYGHDSAAHLSEVTVLRTLHMCGAAAQSQLGNPGGKTAHRDPWPGAQGTSQAAHVLTRHRAALGTLLSTINALT